MAQHVRRTPRARTDLSEIAAYIAQDNLNAALAFLNAVEHTFKSLSQSPQLGIVGEFQSPRLDGVRRWRVEGFENYLVFYRPIESGIEVIRVIHGARNIEALF